MTLVNTTLLQASEPKVGDRPYEWICKGRTEICRYMLPFSSESRVFRIGTVWVSYFMMLH